MPIIGSLQGRVMAKSGWRLPCPTGLDPGALGGQSCRTRRLRMRQTSKTVRPPLRQAFALALLAALTALLAGPSPARAQNWPTRPITMVIPFAPGGAVDVMGRILS